MSPSRIDRLLADAPIFDGHNDLPWELRHRVDDQLDLTLDQAAAGLHTDLPRLAIGGVGAQFWSVFVPCSFHGADAVKATLEQIEAVHRLVARHPETLALATSADEVERARASGRIASLLGAEGGHCIDGSLAVLGVLRRLGVRYLTLTHNENTPWADSATDVPHVHGLSDFGREVVRECNRLGVMVDLSHTAPATMHAALDVSTAPAFFSHSSARALCDHPRNVPDDVLTRVRDTRGVVMVTFVPGFLTEECRAWFDRLTAEEDEISRRVPPDSPSWYAHQRRWVDANPPPPTSVADVANHIEHIRDVAGIEHVGLGSDFDGVVVLPDGLSGVDCYPALLAELAERGWSDWDLRQLTWHNALRVLRDTESVADAAVSGRPIPPPPMGEAEAAAIARFDVEQLADALEDNSGYGNRWLLDPATGEVHLWNPDSGLDGDESVDPDTIDESWLFIDPVPSREWYLDMADFAGLVSDDRMARRLERTLEGKGAFRRFKEAVYDTDLGDVWYDFRLGRARRRAVEYLHDNQLIDDAILAAYLTSHPDPLVP